MFAEISRRTLWNFHTPPVRMLTEWVAMNVMLSTLMTQVTSLTSVSSWMEYWLMLVMRSTPYRTCLRIISPVVELLSANTQNYYKIAVPCHTLKFFVAGKYLQYWPWKNQDTNTSVLLSTSILQASIGELLADNGASSPVITGPWSGTRKKKGPVRYNHTDGSCPQTRLTVFRYYYL